MSNKKSAYELELMQARIGFVPEGWSFSRVAEVFRIRNNLRKPVSEEERARNPGPYPYYGPTRIQDHIGSYCQDGAYALIGEDGDHFLKFRDQRMTQLVDGKCTVNNHAHVIEGTDKACRKWFYYYFMNRDIFSFLTRQGAGRFKLNKAALEKIPLLVPPVEEQQKITEILFTWEEAIATTEQLLANSEQRKKALMQQLLTGKKRLPGFEGTWKKTRIGDFIGESREVSEESDPSKRLTVKLNLKGVEKRGVRGTESKDSTAHFIRRAGQFIYGKQNIHKGALGIIPKEFDGFESSQDLPAFDFTEKCDAEWFLFFFSRSNFYKSLENKMSGTGSKRLKPRDLRNIAIVAPDLEEQREISRVLVAAHREVVILRDAVALLQQEKKALMQQLLTGKRRVKIDEAERATA